MSVEALSDSELRSKLAEYGYPVGPVTLTTRKILVKKLKNLIETRGSAGSRHSLAARYSSDETDEDATASSVRKKKSTNSRRQTLANPMPPPPSVPPVPATAPAPRSPPKRRTPSRNLETRGSTADEYDHSSSELSNRMTSKTVQKKYTKTYKLSTSNDGLETGSDSDVTEEADKIYNSTKFGMDTDKLYDYKPSERSYPEYDSLKTYDSRPRNVHTTKDDRYSVPLFKPNLSPVQPTNEDTYGRDSLSKDDPLANFKTPYLSEFTRRLSLRTNANLPSSSRSTLSSPLLRPTSTSGLPEVKESDSNGHYSNLRPSYLTSGLSSRYATLTASRPRDVTTRRFKPSDSKEVKNNHNMISLVLVGVVALFFVVLAVVYLGLGGKTEDTPSLSSEDDIIPLCTPGISGERNKPGVNCILKENVEDVYLLLKRIRPILKERAISAACDGSNEKPYLTDKDIVKRFTSEKAPGFQVKNDLRDAQLLIFNNPNWGISLIEVSDTDEESNQVLDTMDKLFQARLEGKLGMVESRLDLPLQCLLAQKLYTIFSSLLIVAVGLLIVVATQKFLVWYLLYKKRAEMEVFQLVSEIITMVEAHHQNTAVTSPGGTEESYVAINHVRDNLIAPKDRRRMAKLWEKAVKYLDQNDSRIRREVQVVAGDEFDVWRWLSRNNLNASGSQISPVNKKAKVWQGQAFETMEGSVNSLTCSPTPCLKIRHMFDPDVEFEEDWETKVQDAILEKCGEGVKILHIRVDRGSREGCVYMKCFSQEDAGKAYRALHGWWFDSNLVTVKYLRLERYHERFPDATRCTAALKPSNNQRLSMQAHYWQSPLETN